jgi:hypothetical protein
VSLGSLTPFLTLRTEERRLRQATALLLMRRTCNFHVMPLQVHHVRGLCPALLTASSQQNVPNPLSACLPVAVSLHAIAASPSTVAFTPFSSRVITAKHPQPIVFLLPKFCVTIWMLQVHQVRGLCPLFWLHQQCNTWLKYRLLAKFCFASLHSMPLQVHQVWRV